MLFLSTFQGNPLCLFVSIQKMRVFPWLTAPRTRWRVASWMVVPGSARTLFVEKGKSKEELSSPVKWTEDTLLFTTDQERFVFFKPLASDKILLLTESLFADRVRKSGEEEIRYSLIPSVFYWNNLPFQGHVYYERMEIAGAQTPESFLPATGVKKGGAVFAVWVPGGMFLYLEQQGDPGGDLPCTAILQDRRGRWEETYNASLRVPEAVFAPDGAAPGETEPLRLDIPYWRIAGELEPLDGVRLGLETVGEGEGDTEAAVTEKRFWTSLSEIPSKESPGPVAFRLFKGRLRVEEEVKSVYAVGILER